jgi:hypothetical protein
MVSRYVNPTYMKDYHAAHKEQRNQYCRGYYWKNKESILSQKKVYGKRRSVEVKERDSERSKRHQMEHKEARLVYEKSRHYKLKMEVLQHYSGEVPVCACCKEDIFEFLTIDHVNGRTDEEKKSRRSGNALYRWIKKSGFPDGFQVLCYNCNCGRKHGECPHQKKGLK